MSCALSICFIEKSELVPDFLTSEIYILSSNFSLWLQTHLSSSGPPGSSWISSRLSPSSLCIPLSGFFFFSRQAFFPLLHPNPSVLSWTQPAGHSYFISVPVLSLAVLQTVLNPLVIVIVHNSPCPHLSPKGSVSSDGASSSILTHSSVLSISSESSLVKSILVPSLVSRSVWGLRRHGSWRV